MTRLTPVDGDPFSADQVGGVRLTPVDGNPFAQKPSPSNGPASSVADASKTLLENEVEGQFLARQRVSPLVFSGKTKPQKLGDLELWDSGPAYKDAVGQLRAINVETDFVAIDPETGKRAVFARNPEDSGTNESGLLSFARTIVPGLATGPVTGIQRAAQAPGATTRAIGNVGTETGAAMAANRAADAVRDEQAFQNLDVRRFGPAFSQGPTASVAKQLTETAYVGAPLKNALDESLRDTAQAAGSISRSLSPSASVEQTGATLQRGLDRYRTAGVSEIEPSVLGNLGIEARAPVQAQAAMSQGAASRAGQAEQIRTAAGEVPTAQTSRGVEVAAARPMNQTLIARRGAQDLSDAEIATLIRTPSSETSFAARQEALYEHAWRQLPARFRINESANPNLIRAVNTNQAFRQLAANEQRAGISGGIASGRFAGMAERVQTNTTLDSLRQMRTEIGRALSNFGMYDARLDRTQLKQLYGAISRDIEIAVQDLANRARIQSRVSGNRPDHVAAADARAAEGALYALRRADRYTRLGIESIDRFSRVVGTDNPQQAVSILIRASLDGTKGNAQLLRSAMAALRPEERNQISALVLQELGKPTGSAARGVTQEIAFSPQSFLTRWINMAPEARALLFGGEHAQAIDDLSRVVSRLANVEALANTSRSGTNALNMTGVLGSFGLGISGNWPAVLGIAGGGWATSVLLSRPSYTRWAVEYARLRALTLRAPLDTSAGRLTAHIQRLGQLATRDPQLLPVYRAIAQENGINERGNEHQPVQH